MIAGQFALVASQLLLMEASKFWVMCLGRLFEGISSAIILVAGLALICDRTPDKDIGGTGHVSSGIHAAAMTRHAGQLGVAMVGLPLGALVGPPVGGALYARWGYRAPFIFTILFTLVDFAGRVLIIEPPAEIGQRDDEEHNSKSDIALAATQELPSLAAAALGHLDLQIIETVSDPSIPAPHVLARKAPELSLLGVMVRLLSSSRTLVSLSVAFFCSFAFSAADVTLPLRLQAVWGLSASRVGVVFIAAIVPTLIWFLTDRVGPAWVAAALLFAGIPWWGALTRTFSLAFFIASFAIENFFIAAVVSPVTAELASITRTMDGVGYAHSYGTFNIIFGLGNAGKNITSPDVHRHAELTGSASPAGAIVGGQIYSHSSAGWPIICYINVGLLTFTLAVTAAFLEERPLALRGWDLLRGRRRGLKAGEAAPGQDVALGHQMGLQSR
ncbi:predicted protein [Postia placenta Mad-698-R]|uniref:Major facilitator superfamily (MFS) profile domain-containing protein n=1 Tax=Postia placenta MAD-698-R-SB12 TaxID=670580 RepID=A0A1X6MQ57_9APHY|nr:hypothetical protein POSPLADRAFT_1154090 [Postia placenta MAD-698-R-SB12]EED79796.1 predicted protein [Postia placenta Mad-698-R]OSX58253.1 hypothetical protein POSPLADRAFT_1154090 [Postia placenta MAD-698-R-SB12]